MRTQFICLFFSLINRFGIDANAIASYSKRCRYRLDTYWNHQSRTCEKCETSFQTEAGYEFAPNCGRQDDGGQPTSVRKPCGENTFNNGSYIKCQKCTSCPLDQRVLAVCNTTRDTQCCETWEAISGECQRPDVTTLTPTTTTTTATTKTTVTVTESTSSHVNSITSTTTSVPAGISHQYIIWIATVLLLGVCVTLLHYLLNKKCCSKFYLVGASKDVNLLPRQNDKKVDDLLAFAIQEAPLQTVLDDLDVLEELIMLLDPDSSVVKTTRHVATRCSFSATWINYAYSMRDSKSPLKAVLEGITTKFPEWTIGNLAMVFNDIGRNDAVAVLAKLLVLKERF